MKAFRIISLIFAIGLIALAIPGLVVNLHDSWFENLFHILAFGGLAAYLIRFALTGRYKLGQV